MWCAFVGIPENTWHHFEKGRRPITMDAALKIYGKTGATLEWILLGEENALPMHLIKKLERVPDDPPASASPEKRASNG
jgi:plasmid maintenance system antidote protein VapI